MKKWIFYLISVAAVVVGVVLKSANVDMTNIFVRIIYALVVFFPITVAAMEASKGQFDDNGKRRLAGTMLYYFMIITFVAFIVAVFWIEQIVYF